MLPKRLTRLLIPRKLAGTGSRHSTKDNLALHRLQVAEKLLALITGPDQAVLGTAP
jgi:hypothetical protein